MNKDNFSNQNNQYVPTKSNLDEQPYEIDSEYAKQKKITEKRYEKQKNNRVASYKNQWNIEYGKRINEPQKPVTMHILCNNICNNFNRN